MHVTHVMSAHIRRKDMGIRVVPRVRPRPFWDGDFFYL